MTFSLNPGIIVKGMFLFLKINTCLFFKYQKPCSFYRANTAVIAFNAHDPLMSYAITHLREHWFSLSHNQPHLLGIHSIKNHVLDGEECREYTSLS